MVQRIIKIAGKAAKKATSVLFADPKLLFKEERHLVSEPFFWQGTNGKGVLLLHGWSSTPYEVRRLGKYLNENGYTVLGIRLAGHGTVPSDLKNVKWEEWDQDAKNGFQELKKSCDKVFVAGTSIGANLAMILAKEEKEIAGLVLMATPHKMRMEKVGLFCVKLMLRFGGEYRRKFYPPTFGLSTSITRIISYQSYPVKNLMEVYETVKAARKDLAKITQPCFVIQSASDHIVSKNSLEIIYAGVGSKVKKKKYIEKAYHTFISDIKNEHVFQDILDFINEN